MLSPHLLHRGTPRGYIYHDIQRAHFKNTYPASSTAASTAASTATAQARPGSTNHLFFSTRVNSFYASCCYGSCSWQTQQAFMWYTTRWLSEPHPCKCSAAEGTGNLCTGSVITPPHYGTPAGGRQQQFAASKCYRTPFLSRPLTTTPPASVRQCCHTPWFITPPFIGPSSYTSSPGLNQVAVKRQARKVCNYPN